MSNSRPFRRVQTREHPVPLTGVAGRREGKQETDGVAEELSMPRGASQGPANTSSSAHTLPSADRIGIQSTRLDDSWNMWVAGAGRVRLGTAPTYLPCLINEGAMPINKERGGTGLLFQVKLPLKEK